MAEILVKIKTNDRAARGEQGKWLKLIVAVLGVLAAIISVVAAYLKAK